MVKVPSATRADMRCVCVWQGKRGVEATEVFVDSLGNVSRAAFELKPSTYTLLLYHEFIGFSRDTRLSSMSSADSWVIASKFMLWIVKEVVHTEQLSVVPRISQQAFKKSTSLFIIFSIIMRNCIIIGSCFCFVLQFFQFNLHVLVALE